MKIKFDLKNCYGIGAMVEELEYKEGKGNTAIMYAPNGTMKTSLAKTFKQLLAGKAPCDELYKDRVSSASITIDGTAINKDNTYVFVNNDADGSKQISTFLANADLKSEYEAIYQQLDSAKKALKKKIKQIAKSSDCEDEILAAFKCHAEDNFFDCVQEIKDQLLGELDSLEGYDFKFNDVFERSGKVKDFIRENQTTIERYFQKYTELIQSSHFFSSNAKFGTSQANSLLKSVGDNRYFKAGHKFELGGVDKPKSIASKEDMANVIDAEMRRIFKDDDIKTLFNDLENKLEKNLSLKGFKDVIQAYPELIPELMDYDEFERKILRGYLKQCEAEMNELTGLYASKKDALKDIVRRANKERSQWEKVIDLFNSRFFVPFTLDLQNKSDILLSSKTPELQFLYQDGGDAPIQQERKTLVENLSAGEKKAFFILQNIFELEARRANNQQTLLVFDDIADSFDYKNKYAIIEYINDLAKDGHFKIFILTHNFDFYRTVVSRLQTKIARVVTKNEERTVKMTPAFAQPDILKRRLLHNITQRRAFIACIPFARNIIDYTQGDSDDYKLLTACLHLKNNGIKTKDKTLGQILEVMKEVFKAVKDKSTEMSFTADNYWAAIMEEADDIQNDDNEVDIVNKLVLSMAIRLRSEDYMNRQLTDAQKLEIQDGNNLTSSTLTVFKKYHSEDREKECLMMDRVLMLTSENIHINNFMFEPLVDISILHLKQLYEDVKNLDS